MYSSFVPLKFSILLVYSIILASLLPLANANAQDIAGNLQPSVEQLPVGRGDVFSSDKGDGVDRQPTLANLPGGGFVLVYSRYERGDMDSSHLRVVISRDGRTISSDEKLTLGGEVEDAPSFITTQSGTWLYFASSNADLGNVMLWRARLNGSGSFSPPEKLPAIESIRLLTQWPRWVSAGHDAFLTFRGEKSKAYWLRLKNGLIPEAPQELASFRAAYPRVVPMHGQACFFSYQKSPDGGYMATYFSLSPDCSEWSPPKALSWPAEPGKPDVHDAYALPRINGGVDIYYSYPSRKGPDALFQVGFDLYRRTVMADGKLGREERLTAQDDFNPFAPSAHRLPDGTILVSFSDIHANGDNGVSSARLTLFKLSNDGTTPK